MEAESWEFLENFEQGATTKEGNPPSLENLMEALYEIKGYMASAILTSDGEVLYDTTPPQTSGNFGVWMKVFNNLFEHTCNLSESSGFFSCQQVSMHTGDNIVIISSSGQSCQDGFRLLVIINHLDNEALIQRKLDKLLPPLMRHLAWYPDNLVSLYLKNLRSNTAKSPESSGMSCGLSENRGAQTHRP